MRFRSVKAWLTDNVGWLAIIMALVGGVTYGYEVHAEHERASCQSLYNRAFAQQLTERSALASSLSDAQTHILSSIGAALAAPPTKDAKVSAQRVKDFLQLFSDFDRTTAQIEANRAATPLPPIPDCH